MDYIASVLGGAKPTPVVAAPSGDGDFADFAAAPSPEASASPVVGQSQAQQTFGPGVPMNQRPYTKWYRVHERTSIQDFYVELFIVPVIALLVLFHVWGTRKNKSKAKAWISAHAPTLANEFAVVGFGGANASNSQLLLEPERLIRERGKDTYLSYATGRQNIAFVDVKISLLKRYNPLSLIAESGVGFFFDSYATPAERVEIIAYPFDGREEDVVPKIPGSELELKGRSNYDGFIWAIVHKDSMRTLRDQRYDLSLTVTKEHAKLPDWATIMSESAELTDLLLTKELVAAVKDCGDDFESLILTDMPEDAPKTLDELVPKKKLILTVRLGNQKSAPASNKLLGLFLRIPDSLTSGNKLRPEVLKKVKATRDEEARKIKKLEEQDKAEERKAEADKSKKEEREKKLKGMSADEQRKFLDKEREKDQRRAMGRRTQKA